MRKSYLSTIVIIALLTAGILVYFMSSDGSETRTNNNSSFVNQPVGSMNTEDIPKLSAEQKLVLGARIEQWELYQRDNTTELGTGNCGNEAIYAQLQRFYGGEKRTLRLNEGLRLIYTPNYFDWNQSELDAFANNPEAFCAAGGVYPYKAFEDRILWKGVCSTGYESVPGDPGYDEFVACLQAEKVLDSHFRR